MKMHVSIIRASQFIHLSLRKDVDKKAGKKLRGSSIERIGFRCLKPEMPS